MDEAEHRTLQGMSDAEWRAICDAAVDWQYLTVKAGRMARKSGLDAWLMQRYGLDHADAHTVSNTVEGVFCFVVRSGRVVWTARRPEPQYADYPNIPGPGGRDA